MIYRPSNYVTAHSTGGATTLTTTGFTTTTGSCLVVMVFAFANTIGATPVTDSKSNTWTAAIASVGTTQGWGAMFYAKNCTGGASHTFTFTPSSSDFISMAVYEIPGADLTSPLNGTNSSISNSTTHASGTITAGAVPEVFIGGGALSRGAEATPVVVTADLEWFPQTQLASSAVVEGLATAHYLAEAGAVKQFTFTTASAFAEACLIAGFKQAASAPANTETVSFIVT